MNPPAVTPTPQSVTARATAPGTRRPLTGFHPTDADLWQYAIDAGVCGRPIVRRVTDRVTGDTATVPIRCGSTRETVCPACATRARNLRAQQCAEGWHLEHDPTDHPADPEPDDELDEADVAQAVNEDQANDDAPAARVTRSTRRRSDAADLPRAPMDARTVGQSFTGRDGITYRPSMFVTLTLPSYGTVADGVPVDPDTYDYDRAARDAVAFSALFDRWMQNLRRCAGFKVQYFAAIEAQRRGAAHAHLAIRGAIPRAVLRAVTRATYVQQWWPSYEPADVAYDDADVPPTWDGTNYVDPITRAPLPTWEQALDRLDRDPEARPSHVARFGTQVDVKGIIAPSADADRAIRYLTKYLTKNLADTYATTDPITGKPAVGSAMAAHLGRLHEHTRWIPCGPECANWLRYGVQPKDAGPGAIPGMCPGRAHDRENLGLGGRRVLASRQWSGKTLREHAADRAAVVRETLTAAGIDAPDIDRLAADTVTDDGQPRFTWEALDPADIDRLAADTVTDDGQPRFTWEALDPADIDHHTYAAAILASVRERNQWREQYRAAQRLRDGPHPGCGQPLSNAAAAIAA